MAARLGTVSCKARVTLWVPSKGAFWMTASAVTSPGIWLHVSHHHTYEVDAVEETELRQRARVAIESRRMPIRHPGRLWGGPGVGARARSADDPSRRMRWSSRFSSRRTGIRVSVLTVTATSMSSTFMSAAFRRGIWSGPFSREPHTSGAAAATSRREIRLRTAPLLTLVAMPGSHEMRVRAPHSGHFVR